MAIRKQERRTHGSGSYTRDIDAIDDETGAEVPSCYELTVAQT